MNKIDHRRIHMLIGEISAKNVAHCMERMIELSLASKKPILLLINSEGGIVTHALALCDFIHALGIEVIGVVFGEAASAASVVLQACHQRYMSHNSTIMIHEGNTALKEDVSFEAGMAYLKADHANDRITTKLVAQRTGLPFRYVRKLERRTSFITASNALDLNLIDGIITGSIWELGNVRKKNGKRTKN